jgi:transposase
MVRAFGFRKVCFGHGSSKEATMLKANAVSLTEEQRQELKRITRSGKGSARRNVRARILLKSDIGETDEEISHALDVGMATVERIRRKFAAGGIEAAIESRPQPPRPQKRRLDGEGEAKLVMLACSTPPDEYGHWTLDLLADQMVKLNYVPAISGDTVGRTLKKTPSSPG